MKRKYLIVLLLIFILGAFSSLLVSPQAYFWYTKKVCEKKDEVNKEACFLQQLGRASFERGEDFAYKLLALLKKESQSIPWCHSIAHGIGTGLYRRDPESWQAMLSRAPQDCSYGLIHGILQEKIATLLKENSTFDFLPTICSGQEDFACNHVLGHMLLLFNNLDVKRSLEMCSVLPNSDEIDLCLRGVFMEYITGFSLVAHGLVSKDWLKWGERLTEIEKLCKAYKGSEQEACWQEMAHAIVAKFEESRDESLAFCERAGETKAIKRCKSHSLEIIYGRDDEEIDFKN